MLCGRDVHFCCRRRLYRRLKKIKKRKKEKVCDAVCAEAVGGLRSENMDDSKSRSGIRLFLFFLLHVIATDAGKVSADIEMLRSYSEPPYRQWDEI